MIENTGLNIPIHQTSQQLLRMEGGRFIALASKFFILLSLYFFNVLSVLPSTPVFKPHASMPQPSSSRHYNLIVFILASFLCWVHEGPHEKLSLKESLHPYCSWRDYQLFSTVCFLNIVSDCLRTSRECLQLPHYAKNILVCLLQINCLV